MRDNLLKNVLAAVLTLAVVAAAAPFFYGKIKPASSVKESPREPASAALPFLKPDGKVPEISAESALAVYIDNHGREKILYEKASSMPLPVASITKLATALVVVKNFPPQSEITVTKKAVSEKEDAGALRPGDVFTVEELLYPLLIESSNDAAEAFAESVGREKFMAMMNGEADGVGMVNTFFANPSGLDDSVFGGETGYSTAADLVKLARFIEAKYPEIFDILGVGARDLYDARQKFHHRMQSTNELLSDKNWPVEILGGKTGETAKAKQALLLLVKSPNNDGYIASVVLRSDRRFQDTKMLIDWAIHDHIW